jgi:hypothetical protein
MQKIFVITYLMKYKYIHIHISKETHVRIQKIEKKNQACFLPTDWNLAVGSLQGRVKSNVKIVETKGVSEVTFRCNFWPRSSRI